jgi:type IV fimbrial biogenesis protein FimT
MDINRPKAGQRIQSGVTLVELVSTLAVATLLLATGIPEFKHILASNTLTREINTMVTHLHLARSEAVKRGKRVVLCPSSNGFKCLTGIDWSQGYLLFVDQNGNREFDETELRLRHHVTGRSKPRITSTAGRRSITYRPDGSATGSNLSLTFCPAQQRVSPKAVIVSNTGRPRVSGESANGSPLLCT